MRIVLFGAGASHGAGDIVPELPPLGGQLFAELARCYPRSWGSFPDSVDQAFKDNFESGMQILWNNYSAAVSDLMQQMALYFLQFRPRVRGATLYGALAKEIQRNGPADRILLSTLNYECVLELELAHHGLSVNYGDFPGEPGSVTVWKLHGSCNMLPYGMRATRGIRFTRGVAFNTAVRAMPDLNDAVTYCLSDNALPPVMCLFMKGKPVQVSPGTVEARQERWRSLVAQADKIAVVGVRPNKEDSHLWDALANSPAHLLYGGNSQAFETWSTEFRGGKPSHVIGNDFRECFDRLMNEIVR